MGELALLDGVPIDGYLAVSAADAIATARRLSREEGVFAGFSPGTVVAAGLRLLEVSRPAAGTRPTGVA